jgi:hypothetical protein
VTAEAIAKVKDGGSAEAHVTSRRTRSRDPDDMFTVAILETEHSRWRGMRAQRTLSHQVRKAANLLRDLGRKSPKAVTRDDLVLFCRMSLAQGCAHGTVRYRLACLSAIGVKMPEDFHFKVPRPPKWFLRPEDEERVPFTPDLHPTALHFIQWTVATGLRVEESLRVEAPEQKSLTKAAG